VGEPKIDQNMTFRFTLT